MNLKDLQQKLLTVVFNGYFNDAKHALRRLEQMLSLLGDAHNSDRVKDLKIWIGSIQMDILEGYENNISVTEPDDNPPRAEKEKK